MILRKKRVGGGRNTQNLNQNSIWFFIKGTKNVVNLCIKYNVPRLIYTSDASVTLTSYLGLAPFAVVVNLTESKTKQVTSDKDILIPGYSVTKHRAEKIVLGANGTNLANGTGTCTLPLRSFYIFSIC